jgi:ATP-dependent protease ClpP protease subunit
VYQNDGFRRRLQIEEDTDRDRYMSPLEAKQYGIIDHVIGGDDAGFQVQVSILSCSRSLR